MEAAVTYATPPGEPRITCHVCHARPIEVGIDCPDHFFSAALCNPCAASQVNALELAGFRVARHATRGSRSYNFFRVVGGPVVPTDPRSIAA